ncbi:MAG: hypothetical protein NC933_01980, partial [Candidatus Omnitrophica bacterium]|nr:hypothetical protein [Candidatus Omnitrophota bacterium]
IYVSWKFDGENEETPLLVRFYNEAQQTQTFIFIILAVIVITIPASILLLRKHIKKEFFKGFNNDEKRTIDILIKRKFVY